MAQGEHREEYTDLPASSFDTSEPNSTAVSLFGAATVVFLLVVAYGIYFVFVADRERRVEELVLAPAGEELKAVRAREDNELHSYKFVDRQKGTVRIPIDRAMTLLVEEAKTDKLKYPTKPMSLKEAAARALVVAPAAPATPGAPGAAPASNVPAQGGATPQGAK